MRTKGALGKSTLERMAQANTMVQSLTGKLVERGFTPDDETAVFEFFKTNARQLTLSLEAVFRAAELKRDFPGYWQQVSKYELRNTSGRLGSQPNAAGRGLQIVGDSKQAVREEGFGWGSEVIKEEIRNRVRGVLQGIVKEEVEAMLQR